MDSCLQEASPKAAISNCSRFIETPSGSDDELAFALFKCGQAFWELGERELAVSDLAQAVELRPQDRQLREYRVQVSFVFEDYDNVLLDLDWFIEHSQGNYPACTSRCSAKTELGDYWGAISDCEEALKIEPNFAPPYNNMALALYRIGAQRVALNDIEVALSAGSENWAYLDTEAHILVAVDKPERAITAFKRAIELGGDEPTELYTTALREKGYYERSPDNFSMDALNKAISKCVFAGCGLLAEAGVLRKFAMTGESDLKSQIIDPTYLCLAQAGLAQDSVFVTGEFTKTLIAPDGSIILVLRDSEGKARVLARDARGLLALSATDTARNAIADCE